MVSFRKALSPALALACLLITSIPSDLQAAERELSGQRSGLDVVLVLDASGSMLKTDPKNLRYEGAKLLLSFLGEGDRIAVLSFAGSAQVVRELSPISQGGSSDVVKQVEAIQPLGPYSDIAEGIKLAKAVLDASPRPEAQRAIILLSDGRMEPDPAVSPAFARTLELVHDVLPDLKSKETKVFTLAFSDQADRAFLAEVSTATDGLTWFTATPEDIHKSFADLFLAIKRPQFVAQTNRGFKIDEDVDEATFYINREPDSVLTLTTPRGEQMAADKAPEWVQWFRGQNFDVITVKEPDPGNWLVGGTVSQDGFATVLTDLKLLTDWPLVIRAGDTPLVQVRLYEESKPVSLPEMSGVIQYAFQISPTDLISAPIVQEALRDDGKGGDKLAQDGIFSALAKLDKPGEYRLTVVAKGPTFQRSQQIPFTVRPRLVSLKIKSDAVTHEDHAPVAHDDHEHQHAADGDSTEPEHKPVHTAPQEGDDEAELLVTIGKEAVAFRSFEVTLVALDAERRKIKIPMKRSGSSTLEFSTTASKLERAGDFTLRAELHGETKRGEEVEAESLPLQFLYRPRTVHDKPTAIPAPGDGEPKEDARKSGTQLPIIPLVVVTVGAAVIAGAFVMLTKRAKDKATVARQKYVPQKQLLDALSALEERVSTNKVELSNPIFETIENERDSGSDRGAAAPEVSNEQQAESSNDSEAPKDA